MKTILSLLVLVVSVFSSSAQVRVAGDYVGIATPVKWSYTERAVISVLVFADGSFLLETLDYDFTFDQGRWVGGWLDNRGRFSGVDFRGTLWKGVVSSKGGTVKGSGTGVAGKYTFTCLSRYR